MATKLPKWKKALTAAQRRHLTEWGVTSLAGFKRTIEHQRQLREKTQSPASPCHDCTAIYNRLNEAGFIE